MALYSTHVAGLPTATCAPNSLSMRMIPKSQVGFGPGAVTLDSQTLLSTLSGFSGSASQLLKAGLQLQCQEGPVDVAKPGTQQNFAKDMKPSLCPICSLCTLLKLPSYHCTPPLPPPIPE